MSVCGLHLVALAERLERVLGNVHAARYAGLFSVVGKFNVVGVHIELPFFLAEHPAKHAAAMDANAHVKVHAAVILR